MVERAASVEWIVVASDVEAIMLEYNLIKAHRPRFNIRLVDDKSYPYLAVTVGDEWPKATVMRGARRKDTRYFGPYAHAYAIRETLDLLLRSFPIRTCSDAKLRRHQLLGRPCLLYHIERCSGPCVGEIGLEEYGKLVVELMEFLDGDTKPVVDRLEDEMRRAAGELEFERAARLRDRLATVRLAIERQQMVTDTPEDLDALAVAEDELAAAVQVFHVRRGRVVGRHGFIVEKVEPLTTPQLIGRVLEQHYAETPIGIPRDLLVPELPEDVATYEAWLAGLRNGKVTVRVPMRGRKRELLATARQNAEEQLKRHRLRRASDLTSRASCDRGVAAGPRAERGAASHRVLRHEPHPGHRLRGLDGRARGRAAEEKRLPAIQGDAPCRETTTMAPCTRSSHGVFAGSARARRAVRAEGDSGENDGDRRTGPGRRRLGRHRGRAPAARAPLCLPAPAPAPRRRQRPARRRRPRPRGAGPERQDRGGIPGQTVGGGFRSGPAGPVQIPRDSEAIYLLSRPATKRTGSRSAFTASCAVGG